MGLFRQRDDVLLGPADDAAVLDPGLSSGEYLLVAADQVILDRHYTGDTPIDLAARKLLCRNISDIVAMGGVPTHALLTLAWNPLDEKSMCEFHIALEACARMYDVSVVGGDIALLPIHGQVSSLTILGKVEPEKLCLRSGVKIGDFLYCTGEFGASYPSGHHLNFVPRLRESSVLAGRFTRAMMDVSDGLLKDASRMAESSGLSLMIPDFSVIPLRSGASLMNAFLDGEDYELIFAVSPDSAEMLEKVCFSEGINISRLGVFLEGEPGAVIDFKHKKIRFTEGEGFDHFHE